VVPQQQATPTQTTPPEEEAATRHIKILQRPKNAPPPPQQRPIHTANLSPVFPAIVPSSSGSIAKVGDTTMPAIPPRPQGPPAPQQHPKAAGKVATDKAPAARRVTLSVWDTPVVQQRKQEERTVATRPVQHLSLEQQHRGILDDLRTATEQQHAALGPIGPSANVKRPSVGVIGATPGRAVDEPVPPSGGAHVDAGLRGTFLPPAYPSGPSLFSEASQDLLPQVKPFPGLGLATHTNTNTTSWGAAKQPERTTMHQTYPSRSPSTSPLLAKMGGNGPSASPQGSPERRASSVAPIPMSLLDFMDNDNETETGTGYGRKDTLLSDASSANGQGQPTVPGTSQSIGSDGSNNKTDSESWNFRTRPSGPSLFSGSLFMSLNSGPRPQPAPVDMGGEVLAGEVSHTSPDTRTPFAAHFPSAMAAPFHPRQQPLAEDEMPEWARSDVTPQQWEWGA